MTHPDFWTRAAAFIERRRLAILAVGIALAAAGAILAAGLDLRHSFADLLPRDAPAVRNLERIEERMGAVSTLYVAIEGGDWKERQRFAIEAAAALRAGLPPALLRQVETGVGEARAHFDRYRWLYVDLPDLVEMRDRLRNKIEDERRRRLVVDLEGAPPYQLRVDDLRQKYERRAAEYDRFPDGIFVTADRSMQALLLRLSTAGMGDGANERIVARVQEILDALDPEARGYQIRLGGDPVTALEERASIARDIAVVSAACVLLCVLALVLYYRSLRSLLVIGAPVAVGVSLAFGAAALAIGHLNANTAFLGSIVVGNGINFAILLLARYVEALRDGGDAHRALATALRRTWLGTATAALAAAAAYGSLAVTSFRGFSQFGLIGGLGMVFCWLATFTVAPALLSLTGTRWPLRARPRRRRPGRIAAFLERRHRALAIAGIVATAAAAILAALLYRDPFEYDFRNLRSRHAAEAGSSAVGAKVDSIFRGTRLAAGSPVAILVDRPESVAPLLAELRRKQAEGAEILRVESIADLVPPDQDRKVEVLREIRELLASKTLGWMNPAQRREAEKLRPPADLRPFEIADLPKSLRLPFTEKDGRVGLAVFVTPRPGAAGFEGKRLFAFVDAIREVALPSGEVARTSGADVILADIVRAIVRDGPIATALSFAAVVLLVALAFRRLRERLIVLATLVAGVAWMVGAAAAAGLKVNMLNFVAFPITFGIGVDYAVNVYRRYSQEGPGAMGRVLRETGGAVALCSATTIIGYGTLLCADNQAMRSFGLLAVLGEVTTLAAALFFMPAIIGIVERRRAEKAVGVERTRGESPREPGPCARLCEK